MHEKFISEVYAELENAKTEKEKMAILYAANKNTDFMFAIFNTFNPNVKFHFEKLPDYKPMNVPVDAPGTFTFSEALKRSYIFVVGHPKASPNLLPKHRESILIQFLEGMPAAEADAFGKMILKKPGAKGLTKKLIDKAFPQWLSEGK